MLVHRRVTPSIAFAGTHLYIWVERGTVGVLTKNTTRFKATVPSYNKKQAKITLLMCDVYEQTTIMLNLVM